MGSVQAELDRLQALLKDHSIESTPTAELSTLLTTGRTSAALQQWLSSSLGERLCQSHVPDAAEPPRCALWLDLSVATVLCPTSRLICRWMKMLLSCTPLILHPQCCY